MTAPAARVAPTAYTNPVTDTPDRNYPLPRPTDDPRFTTDLTIDIVAILNDHGYPELTGLDMVGLQQALFRFLYAAPTAEDGA